MMRFTKILAQLTAVLIVCGLILHEVIPHHHHTTAGRLETCCESHNHNTTEHSSEQACIFLSNIHFENHKPALEVHSHLAKQSHINGGILPVNEGLKHLAALTKANKAPCIPVAKLAKSEYLWSFKFRGPPAA